MFYSVDRADEKYVLLCDDDGETKELRRFHIKGEVNTGDVFRFENGEFIFDEQETSSRKKRIQELENELFE